MVCFACSGGGGSSSSGSSGATAATSTGPSPTGGSGARSGGGSSSGGSSGSGSGGGVTITQSGNPYYGSGVYMGFLENLQIGPSGQVDARFLCEHTGAVVRLSLQYQNESPGYMGGTGGTIQWQLCNDDGTTNHYPNLNSVLWTGTDTTASYSAKGSIIATFTLPSISFTAGTIYHIVLTNTDPNPTTNYVSLDLEAHNPTTFAQPFDPSYILTAMYGGNGSWSPPGDQGVPDYNVWYADGYIQGTGYCDTNGISSPAVETFTVSGGDKTVTALNAGGTGLSFTLAQGSTVIASGSLGAGPLPAWGTYVFPSPITLVNGTTYTLTVNGTLNRALQKASTASNYIVPAFMDGYLSSAASPEYTLGSSYDMEFYFSLQ